MLPELINAASLAFPIPLADAAGCYYNEQCATSEFWSSLEPHNAAKIPTDGVLVLQGAHNGPWDDSVLANVAVEVTLDGQPIAGALELGSAYGVLVWRPQDPWTPATTYQAHVKATHVDPEGYYCAPAEIAWDGEVVIDAAPGGVLVASELTGTPSVQQQPQVSLETLACCEGASPTEYYDGCGGTYVQWDSEMCAPLAATGFLVVEFTGTPAATGPAAQQIVYSHKAEGIAPFEGLEPNFTVVATAPFCVALAARDLASGKVVVAPEQCFGDDVAAQLGPQVLAPPASLKCELQQCEPNGTGWDPDKCTPLDPDETPTGSDTVTDGPDSEAGSSSDSDSGGEDLVPKGCACDSDAGGDASLLALVGALGLVTRRRRPR